MSSALLALLSLALQGYEVRREAPDVEPRARGILLYTKQYIGMVETNLETPISLLVFTRITEALLVELGFCPLNL